MAAVVRRTPAWRDRDRLLRSVPGVGPVVSRTLLADLPEPGARPPGKLAALTRLKYLYLGQTSVTDKGLEHLKGMSKLQSLSLAGTQVTDAGLANLKDLRELRVLEIKDTKVTNAGVAELKKSLPDLVVR